MHRKNLLRLHVQGSPVKCAEGQNRCLIRELHMKFKDTVYAV